MVALVVESWIWWSVVIIVAGSRFLGRRMTLGSFRNFQVDDYGMAVVLCFYTTLIVTINIVRYTNSNLLPPGFDVNDLTPEGIRQREYGSKLILVVEQCQCVTIWGAKLCLITLYLRLTTLRWENLAIRALCGYVIGSFIVMDTLYFAVWCRPFYEYWAVPTDSAQCDAATNHLITNAVFNLSSDCIMLAIGLPMFLRLSLPWRKKAPLIGVFSLGVFVILAAILNKVYSFSDPFGSLWTYWYVRESSTALLVANLPFVWTIWRRAVGVRSLSGVGDSAADPTRSIPELMSRRGTQAPEMQHFDAESKRAATLKSYFAGDDGGSSSSSSSSGAPGEAAGNMSLADMLHESSGVNAAEPAAGPALPEGPEPNPVTHPLLFYTRRATLVKSANDETYDGLDGEAYRTSAGPSKSAAQSVEEDAQTASVPPSSGSQKSTRSVV